MWRTNAESQLSKTEVFIRRAIDSYPKLVSERNAYQRYLGIRENKDIRDAYVMDDVKVAMIEGWFELLNYDERFVVEQHLIQELEWPRIAINYSERWKGLTRAERTLVAYQASGLKKIVEFVENHQEMIIALFSDIWETLPEIVS